MGGSGVRHAVMLAEDDPRLADVLVRSLDADGFEVSACTTGNGFVARVLDEPPDALIIDIGLPDADGRDVCQALRARGVLVPVIFLTARDALSDRVSGFTAGGDDYLTKPVDLAELTARLQALLRRFGTSPAVPSRTLSFDPTRFTVGDGTTSVRLSPTEFRLLATLAARPRTAVLREALIHAAWPHGAIVHNNTLDVYIARLRRKLRGLDTDATPVTVHGVGYRLTAA